jgi:DNA-binding CsgD family transcriptional regulator
VSSLHDQSALNGRTPHDFDGVRGHLSPRENEVLAMAAEGMTNNEVAARLTISVHAVKFHLASIYRKLGVSNRTEAAVHYLRAAGSLESTGTDPLHS